MTKKILARGWGFEIDTDPLATTPTGSPAWTAIKGINTFTLSGDKEDADTSDFDSEYNEHIPAMRSREVSIEGYYLEDGGTRDAGQDAVDEYTEMVGQQAMATIRITSPGGVVKEYVGSLSNGDIGGGNTDATSWGATLTVSGKPTSVQP